MAGVLLENPARVFLGLIEEASEQQDVADFGLDVDVVGHLVAHPTVLDVGVAVVVRGRKRPGEPQSGGRRLLIGLEGPAVLDEGLGVLLLSGVRVTRRRETSSLRRGIRTTRRDKEPDGARETGVSHHPKSTSKKAPRPQGRGALGRLPLASDVRSRAACGVATPSATAQTR